MNTRLAENGCPELTLEIDYYKDIKIVKVNADREVNAYRKVEDLTDETLLLCLFYRNACISSLTLEMEKDNKTMSIDSKTKEGFRRRNFNLFLRATSIIIAKLINPECEIIVSYSHNPVSAITMLKNFNVTTYNMEDDKQVNGYSVEEEIKLGKKPLLNILSIPNTTVGLVTKARLDDNEILAERIIDNLIEEKKLRCPDAQGGGKTNKKRKTRKKSIKTKKSITNKPKFSK